MHLLQEASIHLRSSQSGTFLLGSTSYSFSDINSTMRSILGLGESHVCETWHFNLHVSPRISPYLLHHNKFKVLAEASTGIYSTAKDRHLGKTKLEGNECLMNCQSILTPYRQNHIFMAWYTISHSSPMFFFCFVSVHASMT